MADLLIPKRVGKDKFLLSDFQHDFDEINKEILDLANKDELNKTLADLESNLNQKINKSKEEMSSDYNYKINEVEKQVDTNRAELDDLKDEVTFKASKEDVSVVKSEIIDDYNKKFDTINTQIEEEKSQLDVLNNKIELKVEKNELDSLETKLQGEIDSTNGTLDEKIKQNSSAIELLNNELQLKVTQSDIHNVKTEIQNEFGEQVSTINSTINEHSSSIDMLSNKIELKVESTDLEELKTTIGTDVDSKVTDIQTQVQQNSAAITALSNEITLQVKQETADVATMSELTQTSDSIIASFQSTGDNLLLNGRPRNNMNYWYTTYSTGTTNVVSFDGTNTGCNWEGEYFKSGIWWDGTYVYNDSGSWCCLWNNSINNYKFRVGNKYSISLIIYNDKDDKAITFRVCDGNGVNTVGERYFTVTNGYQYINFEFTASQAGGTPQLGLYLETLGDFKFYIPWAVVREGNITKTWIPNADEIEQGNTTITKDGVTVTNGALTIKNNNNENVFYADTSGNLTLQGKVVNGSGTYTTTMDRGGLVFRTTGENVAAIRSTRYSDNTNINGLSISMMQQGDYLDLGTVNSTDLSDSDAFTPVLRIARNNNEQTGNFVGIQLKGETRLDVGRTLWLQSPTSYPHEIFGNTSGNLCLYGDNGVNLGYKAGDSQVPTIQITETPGSSGSQIWFTKPASFNKVLMNGELDMNQYSLKNVGNFGAIENKATRISNINAILPSGWYAFGDDCAGSPPTTWGVLLTFKAFTNDMCQIIHGTNNVIYMRWWANNTYTSWKSLG